MSAETLMPWPVASEIQGRVAVSGLRDEQDGLAISISHESSGEVLATIVFLDFIAYRNVNESYRLRTWEQHQTAALPSLLIVENSEWVKWVCEESRGVLDVHGLVHYAIYTADDCIDVIARRPPTVNLVTHGSPFGG